MTPKERISRRIKEKEVEEKRAGDTGLSVVTISSAIDMVPKGGNTDCALQSPSGIPSVSTALRPEVVSDMPLLSALSTIDPHWCRWSGIPCFTACSPATVWLLWEAFSDISG